MRRSRKPRNSGKALKKSSLIKKKLKSLMNLRRILKNLSLSVWTFGIMIFMIRYGTMYKQY
jgi:hypothetical protein